MELSSWKSNVSSETVIVKLRKLKIKSQKGNKNATLVLYEVSQFIVKFGKSHSIAEKLILTAVIVKMCANQS